MPTVIIPDATVTLVAETCYKCGVVFAWPTGLMRNRRQDKQSFWCPNGHSQAYVQCEADRLRDRLAAEKHAREQAQARIVDLHRRQSELYAEKEHVERRLRGTKAVVTRMKRRAIAGRCPCCSDQFKDLERHMKAKHPNFDPDKGAEALAGKE